MRLGVLFTGGKDSTYSALLAREAGHEISALISIISDNPHSYMFHTPSISQVSRIAGVMGVPLVTRTSRGEEESELRDLEACIREAMERHALEGIVTGAVESVYQASRVQRICNGLGLECFNPLWQREQAGLLGEMVARGFRAIVTGVAAQPLDRSWLGREIDGSFIRDSVRLREEHGINPAGEGGEFETLVLDCPLFSRGLRVAGSRVTGSGNSFRMEVELE